MAGKVGKFIIFRGADARWWWHLRSPNGRKLSGSLEGFSSVAGARRGIITAHNVGEYAIVVVRDK